MMDRILPIFPLPLVQFPGALTTLHIFEAKYQQMLKDIMAGDKMFGVIFSDSDDSDTESINNYVGNSGCAVEVVLVQGLPDGRSNILCLGQQRFKLLNIIGGDQYISASVEFFDDEPTFDDLDYLIAPAKKLFQRVLTANRKLNDDIDNIAGAEGGEGDLPELPDDPQIFSFIVAAYLDIPPEEKQPLLDITDTKQRLKAVNEILEKAADEYEQRSFVHGIAKQNGHAGKLK